MTPHDQQRLAAFIDGFARDCDLDRPFFLIIAGQNKSVAVRYYPGPGPAFEQVCASVAAQGFKPPLVLTAIALNGRAWTANVEIEIARGVLQ